MKRTRRGYRLWPVGLGMLWAVIGCGGGVTEVEVGCRFNDTVAEGVRRDVEAAASRFFDRARGNEFEAVYADAASAVKVRTAQDFTGPIAHAVRNIGLPDDLRTEQLTVIRFGPEFSYQPQVEVPVTGQDLPMILSLTEYPVQALVVQTGLARGETVFYSTLWHLEEGAWRLAGFFLRPATLLGKRWNEYADWADAQLAAGNSRNAALLLNAALELVVPNGWTKPPEFERLEHKQSRISVSHLPVNTTDSWIAESDTFRVYHSGYASLPELAVLFRYLPPGSPADTTTQREYGDRLYRFIVAQFPEYPEVFSAVVLQAMEPGQQVRPWTKVYPLIKEP